MYQSILLGNAAIDSHADWGHTSLLAARLPGLESGWMGRAAWHPAAVLASR